MKISELNPNQLTDEQMTALLFKGMKDDLEKGDCIFVFGSKSSVRYRLPEALQLYKDGRAKVILFSGGVIWDGNALPEAELLKNKAKELGVPDRDLLIENVSTNTKENVLASLFVLDRFFQLHKLKRLLIVTTNYHMRRAYLTLKTYMPSWIEYSLCPAQDQVTKGDNWFLFEKGRQRVEGESKRLLNYIKQGAIIDDDFPL